MNNRKRDIVMVDFTHISKNDSYNVDTDGL